MKQFFSFILFIVVLLFLPRIKCEGNCPDLTYKEHENLLNSTALSSIKVHCGGVVLNPPYVLNESCVTEPPTSAYLLDNCCDAAGAKNCSVTCDCNTMAIDVQFKSIQLVHALAFVDVPRPQRTCTNVTMMRGLSTDAIFSVNCGRPEDGWTVLTGANKTNVNHWPLHTDFIRIVITARGKQQIAFSQIRLFGGKSKDCQLSQWSPMCPTDTCHGESMASRTRTIIANATGDGTKCGVYDLSIDNQTCINNCFDCIMGDWSDFGECNKPCGGGKQFRKRLIIRPSAAGCPCLQCASNLEESRECNMDLCPDDCVISNWSLWSSCTKNCIGTNGFQERIRKIDRPARNNGTKCDDNLKETRACSTCPIECVLSQWTATSKCVDCGDVLRTRSVVTPPVNNGSCDFELNQTLSCALLNNQCMSSQLMSSSTLINSILNGPYLVLWIVLASLVLIALILLIVYCVVSRRKKKKSKKKRKSKDMPVLYEQFEPLKGSEPDNEQYTSLPVRNDDKQRVRYDTAIDMTPAKAVEYGVLAPTDGSATTSGVVEYTSLGLEQNNNNNDNNNDDADDDNDDDDDDDDDEKRPGYTSVHLAKASDNNDDGQKKLMYVELDEDGITH